jgi:hypothetical protein
MGLLVPSRPIRADESSRPSAPSRTTGHRAPEVSDVRLDENGSLKGIVIGPYGQSMPRQAVVLSLANRELARTASDKSGRFELPGLRGGVYQLSVGDSHHVYRVWQANAAPPISAAEVTLLAPGTVQRGQRPIGELFIFNPLVLGVIIAAAIAIPIAVNNSRSAS